jgi:imidazolonepropionase-like amidohydrolase
MAGPPVMCYFQGRFGTASERRDVEKMDIDCRRVYRSVFGLLAGLGLLASCDSQLDRFLNDNPVTEGFIIRNVRVFDGENLLENSNVVVRNDLIESVGMPPVNSGGLIAIDGSGATLLPGFIDSHTHTEDVEQLQMSLRFGVTTVLDMFTAPDREAALRHAAAQRTDVAKFRTTGILATAPGGHGTEYGMIFPTVSNPREARAFVTQRNAQNADHLKIVLNGVRNTRDGMPTLDALTTRTLVDEAHKLGWVVAAHVESESDVRLAIESEVDVLAHSWRDGGARPDLARLIAEANIFVVPTIVIPDVLLTAGAGQQLSLDHRWQGFLSDSMVQRLTAGDEPPPGASIQTYMDGVGSLIEQGVSLLVGSDVFLNNPRTLHGVTFHRELELLVMAGLSPTQALAAGTASAAQAFGLEDRGCVCAGFKADLVLVRGDPTKDILASRDILKVWRDGVEFDRSLDAVR